MIDHSYSEVWADLELEAKDASRSGILRRRVLPEVPADIFIAIMVPHGHRLLILNVADTACDREPDIPECRNLHIRLDKMSVDRPDTISLIIKLEEARYADIFITLSSDILSHVKSLRDGRSVILRALDRLRRWQMLLKELPPGGLSIEAQRGLLGELTFLKDTLLARLPLRAVLQSWKGPDGMPQDFIIGGVAIEIKTSLVRQETVTITSESQLDETGFENLFLGHVSLKLVHHEGMNLPEVVRKIRDIVGDDQDSGQFFDDLLLQVGYLRAHEPLYEKVRYDLISSDLYEVKDLFPRIRTADLPPGITGLQYGLTIASCSEFKVDVERLYQTLRSG